MTAMIGDDKRTLGFWGATGIGVGAIVGGGILALAGIACAQAGPAVLVAFLLNAVVAAMTAASFGEMCSVFPENGGAYAFTRKLLSVRAAFGVGWILWFASIAAAVLYALGFAAYAQAIVLEFLPAESAMRAWVAGRPMAIVLAALSVGAYAAMMLRGGGGGGNWETVGKVVLFALLIVVGLVMVMRRPGGTVAAAFSPFAPSGVAGVAAAMGATFITLQGFDIIAAVGGEVKEPQRNLPRSMFASLAIAVVIYVPLLFLIIVLGVPEGMTIAEFAGAHPETLVAVAVRNFLGPFGFWLIMVAAVLSMLSALYANLLAASRIAFAMGCDRTLPAMVGRVRGEREVPVTAIWATVAVIVVMLVAMPNLAAAGSAASLIFLLSFALTHWTGYLARSRMTASPGVFRTPFFPFVPVVGGLLCGILAVYQGATVPVAGGLTMTWLMLGFILYFTRLESDAAIVDARTQALDPELMRLRGKVPLVLVPVANPERAAALLAVGNAMIPTRVGRLLLLGVCREDATEDCPPPVKSTQAVLGKALDAALAHGIHPEALVTIAKDPWQEIGRVAATYRCSSLLLGLSRQPCDTETGPLERMLEQVDCDVVILGTPPGWDLSQAKRILVPVGGAGGHNLLRARLLASFCRAVNAEITFLRVIPEASTPAEESEILAALRYAAELEAHQAVRAEVIRSDDFAAALTARAEAADLVILGMQRVGRRKVVGRLAWHVASESGAATLIISRGER